LRVLVNSRWHDADDRAAAEAGACTFQQDTTRITWAQCDTGVFALKPGTTSFVKQNGPVGIGRMALAPDGTVWSVGIQGAFTALTGPGSKLAPPSWPHARSFGGNILFERGSQHVWIGRADGVMRTGQTGTPKLFGPERGLSGSQPEGMYQDVEGNVWVGTENGLDRFRPAALQGVGFPQIYTDSPAINPGERGAIWVGNSRLAAPDSETLLALAPETSSNAVTATFAEGPDNIWSAGASGIWHFKDGQREQIPLPASVTYRMFFGIVRDHADGLWISVRRAGVLRLHNGIWTKGGGHPELTGHSSALVRDRQGRIWFGYSNNILRVLDQQTVREYGAADGLSIGKTLAIAQNDDGIWLGGLNGLFHFNGRRFVQILGTGDDPLQAVSGIIVTRDALWLNGGAGITIVPNSELQRAVQDPTHRVQFKRLDHKDGLRGRATNSLPVPSAFAGTDGRLWFSTSAGLFWYDPARQPSNPLPPPVLIRSVNVDGSNLPLADGGKPLVTRANPGRVQIGYTALSLTTPERMRFRYMLDGVDQYWQEGGPERIATYTDLKPGSYRFRVKASNNDNVWSVNDALLEFEVTPTYYQTVWFKSLCAVLAMLAIWRIHKLRLNHEYRRLVDRIQARHEERERVARDLHDTILQSFQALLLHTQLAWQKLPPDSANRQSIERALDLAEAALIEGRDKVHELRGAGGSELDLASEIRATLATEFADSPVTIDTEGEVQALMPDVHEECRLIAREAARNSLRHARAGSIVIELRFGAGAFSLSIRDDGQGMPDTVLEDGRACGRWGFVGMRERAKAICGEFHCNSVRGEGTCITVLIPAGRAYQKRTSDDSRLVG
jgi:signal transduction histidine kinase